MLKYSKDQKISINLCLINNDGNPESDATINYKLYNSSNTLELSGNDITYNDQLGGYIDIIDPSTDWLSQDEGIYYIVWEINNTVEDYPNIITEELHIHDYDNKLNRLLGISHENVFIDEAIHDKYDNLISARLRIYSDASSVGTDNNVIATYRMEADTTNIAKFTNWKQIRES